MLPILAFTSAYQQSYPHLAQTNCHSAVELKRALWHA